MAEDVIPDDSNVCTIMRRAFLMMPVVALLVVISAPMFFATFCIMYFSRWLYRRFNLGRRLHAPEPVSLFAQWVADKHAKVCTKVELE